VKVPHSERVLPPFTDPAPPSPAVAPRALRTPLIERLGAEPEAVDPAEAGARLLAAVRAGAGHEEMPFAGQSAGLVREVLAAGEVVRRVVAEAEAALAAHAPAG
jgi:nitronate monooxygenase/enoyl-[acyl-carrier protein] reductase II